MGVLSGKVVVATGGGNGIGRECALLAGREGASVLVNDPAAAKGEDAGSAGQLNKSHKKFALLAAKRSELGQRDDHARWRRVRAGETSSADCTPINPAGILRDGMFHKMRRLKAVIDVHLHGAFCDARRSSICEQDGSYVLFTSTSGLIGNIGQANYAAAKQRQACRGSLRWKVQERARTLSPVCMDADDRIDPGEG